MKTKKTNVENFDDGLTRVAPKGEFKSGKKELIFAERIKNIYKNELRRFLKIIKYKDGTFGFMLTDNNFGYFALNKTKLNKLRKFFEEKP